MTGELAETFRRADRDDCAGIIHFAYISWFQDVWNEPVEPFNITHCKRRCNLFWLARRFMAVTSMREPPRIAASAWSMMPMTAPIFLMPA